MMNCVTVDSLNKHEPFYQEKHTPYDNAGSKPEP